MEKEPQIARLAYIIYTSLENKNLEFLSELTDIPIEKIQQWMKKFNWEHRQVNLFQTPPIFRSTKPNNIIANFFNQLINKIENSNDIIDNLEIDEVLKLLGALSRLLPIVNKIHSTHSDIDLSQEDEKFINNFTKNPEALELAHKLLELINQ